MRAYVANCTRQHFSLTANVPEMGIVQVPIRIGGQAPLPEMNPLQFEAVVKQMSRYGMVAIEEVPRTRAFVGFCYSLDKPIPAAKLLQIMNQNQGVLISRGQEIRQEAAVALSQSLDRTLRDQGVPTEVAVLEMTAHEEGRAGEDLLQEGVTVDKTADMKPTTSNRPPRKQRRG